MIQADGGHKASIHHVQTTSDTLLAKRVDSLMGSFERAGFEAPGSQRRRPDVIGEIGNFRQRTHAAARVGENNADTQISDCFGDGLSLDGLIQLT